MRSLSILSIVFILFSCSKKQKSTGTENRFLSSEIYRYVQEVHDSGSFNGTILVADSAGIIYAGAFGFADRENKIPLTTGSNFYLASVSKQFTATAVLMLMAQRNINMGDPILGYIPELPEIYNEISFHHLLTHTSGIPDYYEFMEPHQGFNNQDVLKILESLDSLEFVPGTQYKYSNSGYVLLSILVDKISGKSFAEFLREYAFKKAGLQKTIVFDENAGPILNRVKGYGPDGTLTDYGFRTTGGGGIFSNVEDLYKWHLALQNHIILEQKIQDLAYQPTRLKNDSLVYYGYGWSIDPDNAAHVYHEGELEGFRTFFDRHLDEDIVIIILSNNSSGNVKEISMEIYRIIISGSMGT